MLLKELKNNEVDAFMTLLLEFVNVDNNIAKSEKEVIEKFKQVLNKKTDEKLVITYDEAVKIIQEATTEIKRITYFELLGVALVDGEYESSEIDFLESLANQLDIDRATKFAFTNYYYDFNFDKLEVLSDEEVESEQRKLIETRYI